ncbi:sigma-70 family RNA polymerase sigma factor [Humisphaera borealis]|uniref:Sigma-70 family RNA polymerase sigma factor n=1 Tax=Humisphaera borealis TaxID=2807512 RepID=A0A7M2X350_9BACT|nr:sigma-70 family RNA polymerase sigma factor [Humisphaera borealis]QOV91451.1 sigma-70 family RNA polymerase sigma factor [Humisphaera borealis]
MKRDSEQFLALLTACQSSVYAYIVSLLPNRQQADDILQETNMVCWRKGDEFQEGTSFVAWACQIAYFNVLSYRRRRSRDKHTFGDDLFDYLAERQCERIDAVEDRQQALRRCLEKLPSKQRELIEARYQPGASVRRMAGERETTEGALSQSLYRIRATLLDCIKRNMPATE